MLSVPVLVVAAAGEYFGGAGIWRRGGGRFGRKPLQVPVQRQGGVRSLQVVLCLMKLGSSRTEFLLFASRSVGIIEITLQSKMMARVPPIIVSQYQTHSQPSLFPSSNFSGRSQPMTSTYSSLASPSSWEGWKGYTITWGHGAQDKTRVCYWAVKGE